MVTGEAPRKATARGVIATRSFVSRTCGGGMRVFVCVLGLATGAVRHAPNLQVPRCGLTRRCAPEFVCRRGLCEATTEAPRLRSAKPAASHWSPVAELERRPPVGSLAAEYPPIPHEKAGPSAVDHALSLDRYLLHSPIPAHTVQAFATLREWLDAHDADGSQRPLILDSGCGTGRSTHALAAAQPNSAVIGVDRSEDRLTRRPGPTGKGRYVSAPSNALLLRAELASTWRLLLDSGLADRIDHHLLLYPNPCPKPDRRGTRWHFHPSLPLLLQLGGSLELRSNWPSYLLEFRTAVEALASDPRVPQKVREAAARRLPLKLSQLTHLSSSEEGLTRFEQKYWNGGEVLYRLTSPDALPPVDGRGNHHSSETAIVT
eukprot:gnl/TRDRNA2_/TRDRNA2_92544_c0_seq1.p1 gnl/TRDRNA2_/TRDRNA2_92544_c0~~gnl/TRDRNA2_/TRDRNA2_92544_c0_seq1.p1  ORF type:complete len:375 (+),score=35.20 gnl/TRDRNA2_/TRDRNA2_92544_c0_seq1:65-1189(+)